MGKVIIDTLGKKYQKVVNFDIQKSPNLNVCNPNSLKKAMENLTIGSYQNDLVCCAGVFVPIDFLGQTQKDIDFVVDINLKGILYSVQAFLNWHKDIKAKIRPNIVLISSMSAFFHGGGSMTVYDATKAAVSYLVKDLANYNCVVNAVEPGTIRRTNIGGWTTDFKSDKERREIIEKCQKQDVSNLSHEVTVEDIADFIDFLLFKNKGEINGTAITIDGGQSIFKKRI